MSYERLFDWKKLEAERPPRPDGAVAYLYEDRIELAVNVALATGRPLLLSGAPGIGKSTIAADIAWKLGRRYYQEVITSRTQAQDLQWAFDALQRLALASRGGKVDDPKKFIKPGPLWRAFDPVTAAEHDPEKPPRAWGDNGAHAVVLLDEIDKAEPDVPNDLLVVLDQREFQVRESREVVRAAPDLEVLIVITTNGERDLPQAFLRRCICHEIELPADKEKKDSRLKQIARRHFDRTKIGDDLLDAAYRLYDSLRGDAAQKKVREPSIAELIDALRACSKLKIKSASETVWREVAAAAMWKHPTKPPSPSALEAASAPVSGANPPSEPAA